MRLSTGLFFNVLGMTLNFSSAVIFSLLREPYIVAFNVALVLLCYHRVHHVMSFLDACEEATGEKNENQD